jgi:hypothetical protein
MGKTPDHIKALEDSSKLGVEKYTPKTKIPEHEIAVLERAQEDAYTALEKALVRNQDTGALKKLRDDFGTATREAEKDIAKGTTNLCNAHKKGVEASEKAAKIQNLIFALKGDAKIIAVATLLKLTKDTPRDTVIAIKTWMKDLQELLELHQKSPLMHPMILDAEATTALANAHGHIMDVATIMSEKYAGCGVTAKKIKNVGENAYDINKSCLLDKPNSRNRYIGAVLRLFTECEKKLKT